MHKLDCSSGHDCVLLATPMSKAIGRQAVHTHALATSVYLLLWDICCLVILIITHYYSVLSLIIYYALFSIYQDYSLFGIISEYSVLFVNCYIFLISITKTKTFNDNTDNGNAVECVQFDHHIKPQAPLIPTR